MNTFYALLRRAHHLQRWSLMRGARAESVAAHTYDVAVLAHALAELTNTRFGGVEGVPVNVERTLLMALYHDAPEIFTGDLPTPVKYYSAALREAYRQMEYAAAERLLETLPADLRPAYTPLLMEAEADSIEATLVKAADKLAALVKCAEELAAGNREFARAYDTALAALAAFALPAVEVFLAEMLPAFSLPLDEQTAVEETL